MGASNVEINTFTILRNGIDSNLEIIRDDRTGFYNVTKTAKLIGELMIEQPELYDASINKCNRARKWFETDSATKLMIECARITNLDNVRYDLKASTPKRFVGIYVHELLYNQFVTWLNPVYSMRVANLLRDYHKETIRVERSEIEVCVTPDCANRVSAIKHQDLCSKCFYKVNPKVVARPSCYKVKENTIMSSISAAIGSEIIRDKIITGSGCLRRPDGLIRLREGAHNIVIEIDENQHKHLGRANEDRRLCEIYNALGRRALTVVRFNPDRFNGLKNGLFIRCKTSGVLKVADDNRYTEAIDKLIEVIQNAMVTPPSEDTLVEVRLRFDHYT